MPHVPKQASRQRKERLGQVSVCRNVRAERQRKALGTAEQHNCTDDEEDADLAGRKLDRAEEDAKPRNEMQVLEYLDPREERVEGVDVFRSARVEDRLSKRDVRVGTCHDLAW